MNPGDCFLIKTPPSGKHCFVVALVMKSGNYLFFPFSTRRQNSDASCVVLPGEGAPDFIEHESIILYRETLELTAFAIQDATKRGYCTPMGSVSEDLLERILRSALKSKFLKKRLRKIVSEAIQDE